MFVFFKFKFAIIIYVFKMQINRFSGLCSRNVYPINVLEASLEDEKLFTGNERMFDCGVPLQQCKYFFSIIVI